MAGTLTPPSRSQLQRLGEALSEHWRIITMHDPEFAHTQKFVAEALRDGRFVESFLTRATPSASADKPPRVLPKHNKDLRLQREATVTAWMRMRVANWPADVPPPSMRDDIEAARIEVPGIPQQMIEDARWIGWKRPAGRPRKIRQI